MMGRSRFENAGDGRSDVFAGPPTWTPLEVNPILTPWRYTHRVLQSGFYIGLALGLLAVVAVVVLVARILLYASRIANQAQTAAEALEVVRKSTEVLPEARHINEHALAILKGAQSARGALTG